MLGRWPRLLRCREWVFPDAHEWGLEHRCGRFRWHPSTHRAPYGHAWEGTR